MNPLETYLGVTLAGVADVGVKGRLFEDYCVNFLRWPRYGIRQAWRKEHIPQEVLDRTRWERADHGDDILYETEDGRYGIIQCKYRQNRYSGLGLEEINTFLLNLTLFTLRNPELNTAPPMIMLTNYTRAQGHHLDQYRNIQWILWDDLVDTQAQPYLWDFLQQPGIAPRTDLFHLRPDQEQDLMRIWSEPSRRGIFRATCGLGKTAVMTMYMMGLVDQAPHLFILAAPKLQLIDQTYAFVRRIFALYQRDLEYAIFASATGDHDFTTNGGILTTNSAALQPFLQRYTVSRLILTTYDSLEPLLLGVQGYPVHTVLFDEAHRLPARAYPLVTELTCAKFFFTATPSEPMLQRPETFGDVVVDRNLGWAIEANLLCDYEIVTMFHEPTEILEEAVAATEAVNIKARLYAELMERALSDGLASRIIVYCPDKERVNALYRALRVRLPELFVTKVIAETSPRNRHRAEHGFRTHEEAVLLNCQIYREGSDFPQCDGIFYADPMKDPTAIYQSLCRALRKNHHQPGKIGRIIVPVTAQTDLTEGIGTAYDSILNLLAVLAQNDPAFFPKDTVARRPTKLRTILFGRPGNARNQPATEDPTENLQEAVDEFMQQVQVRLFAKTGRVKYKPNLLDAVKILCWETHDSATGMIMQPRQHATILTTWAGNTTRTPAQSVSEKLTEHLVKRSRMIEFAPRGSGNFRLLRPWPEVLDETNYREYLDLVLASLGVPALSPEMLIEIPGSQGRLRRLMELAGLR